MTALIEVDANHKTCAPQNFTLRAKPGRFAAHGNVVEFRPAPVTLESLRDKPLWVAWKLEDRRGSLTKVPYDPGTGRGASAADPKTWTPFKNAWSFVEKNSCNGVGLILSLAAPGVHLGGIDLDTCRDPATGVIFSWAQVIFDRLGTYAEVSPSQTGVKLFVTYRNSDMAALEQLFGPGKSGKSFKFGSGQHPPGLELYCGARYFAVTGGRAAPLRRKVSTALFGSNF